MLNSLFWCRWTIAPATLLLCAGPALAQAALEEKGIAESAFHSVATFPKMQRVSDFAGDRATSAALSSIEFQVQTAAQTGSPPASSTEDPPAPSPDREIIIIEQILDQPVFTPFRREGTLREASRPAYVVTQEQIQAQGARTIQEALKFVPGLITDGTAGGQLGAQSSQFARGTRTGQVLILLDGRPINEFNQGGVDLSSFTADFVDRIEYVAGGGSTLYGSNAVGGVINIITAQPPEQGFQTSANLQIGSFGYNQQSVQTRGRVGDFGYVLGFNRTRSLSDFPFTIPSANVSGDRANADVLYENLNLTLTGDVGDRNRIIFSTLFLNKDLGVPGGVPIPTPGSTGAFNQLTENTRQRTTDLFNTLTWESRLGEGDDSLLTVRLGVDFSDFDFLENNRLSRRETYQTGFSLQVQHNWAFTETQRIVYGADFRRTTARSRVLNIPTGNRNVTFDDDLNQGAVFAFYEVDLSPQFSLNLGLRQDFNTLADGSVTSPAAGFRWQVSPSTSLRGNYARSFRVPTAGDLFFAPFNNPNLKPETGNSFDIGIDQQLGNFGLIRFTTYYNRVNQAIIFDFATFTPQNLGKVELIGFEIAANFKLSRDVFLFTNYTHNDSNILSDPNRAIVGNRLNFTDADTFNLGLSYETPSGFYGAVLVRLVGQRFTNTANTESLPSYTTVDLKLRVPLGDGIALNASLDNLFDERFEVFPGFPGLSRNFRLGVNWQF